jgi:murein DD-endopeptidase MepM/ murein hydrolase activator NlpD
MAENQSTSPLFYDADENQETPPIEGSEFKNPGWNKIWDTLLRWGLGETVIRIGTGLVSIALVLAVIWVMENFYLTGNVIQVNEAAQAAPLPAITDEPEMPGFELPVNLVFSEGITRLADLHTIQPARPRWDVFEYEVVKGDTIFGIAEKFNLKPETILWGNLYVLGDNPHALTPGQKLNILPAEGVYYDWHAGDNLNIVAEFYGVTTDAVINWPGNKLSAETIGELASPKIEPGTWLFVPGGRREFITWSAPRITRKDPAVAKVFGPGYCGTIVDGPVGNGTFVWPTTETYISGYNYSPGTNHWGIDIGGKLGNSLFATDNGVVVYAGENNWGYGIVVVIDHGNGWQSLYAHLSVLNVGCGSYVYQGDVIGYMGSTGRSTGPHLHFELRSDEFGRPNPLNFLQK